MTIFSDRERTRLDGAYDGEPPFAYLDASARPEAARIRQLLEGLVERYPENGRPSLVPRIQDDTAHAEAVFELLVHEWCLKCDMKILAVEPSVPGTTKRPDFLVEAAGGRFYLECVVARGEATSSVGGRRRREDVLRAVDRVESLEFWLAVEHDGEPTHPVPLRALTTRLQRWLAGLDYDNVVANPAIPPVHRENAAGMSLRVRAVPKQGARGRTDGRATGMSSGGIRSVRPWESMRTAVLSKAGRYGEPDLPLVVALDALDQDARLDHAIDALYGTESYIQPRLGEGYASRLQDGVWDGPNGPQCTRLSAVLVAERLGPWTLGQRSAVFVENMWASRPADFVDFRVDAWRREGDDLCRLEGESLQTIFGISNEWPENIDQQ